LWCPEEGVPAVIVDAARATQIEGTAHRTALAITDAALRGFATREGSLFVLGGATAMIVRDLFHRVGARTPAMSLLGWSAPEETRAGWLLKGESAVESDPPTRATIATRETARLSRDGDDLELAMKLDRARDARLASLERSGGHPTIARRLADLDRAIGDRVEAALSSLALASPVLEGGMLAAELLAAAGDLETAVIAARHAADGEPYAPLAALALGRAATWVDDVSERVRLLDLAVARAPSRPSLRWQRFDASLAVANERAALADLEHLEALAVGPQQRHDVVVRAARTLLARGHASLAIGALERALRARPTSEPALITLGNSLAAAGSAERAAEVLARAISMAQRRNAPTDEALVALGRVLGDGLGEPSLALGRLRSVSSTSPEATEARFLEGRYLSQLGDRPAASQAFSRMAERIAALDSEAPAEDRARLASWLEEASKHASDLGELAVARGHLGAALRLLPRDRRLQAEFRRVATTLANVVESPAGGSVGAPRTPDKD
jgi:tetratricopeptide (TPR) repeat protein